MLVGKFHYPLLYLGGVFSGVFAISEAAAVTALYVIFAEVVLYKEVTFKQLGSVAVESMVMVGGYFDDLRYCPWLHQLLSLTQKYPSN